MFELLGVCDVDLENVVGSVPVAVVEVVNDVPSERFEALSLNYQCVVPAKTVHNAFVKHFLLHIHLFALNLFIWQVRVKPHHIRLQSFRRLGSYLQTSL